MSIFNKKRRTSAFKKIGEQIGFISVSRFSTADVMKTIKNNIRLYEPGVTLKTYNILEGNYKNNYWIIFDIKSKIPSSRAYDMVYYNTAIWTSISDFKIPDFDLLKQQPFSKTVTMFFIMLLKLLGWNPTGKEKEIIFDDKLFSKKYSLFADANDEKDIKNLFSRKVIDFFLKNEFKFHITNRDNKIMFYFDGGLDYPIRPKDLLSFSDKANEVLNIFKNI